MITVELVEKWFLRIDFNFPIYQRRIFFFFFFKKAAVRDFPLFLAFEIPCLLFSPPSDFLIFQFVSNNIWNITTKMRKNRRNVKSTFYFLLSFGSAMTIFALEEVPDGKLKTALESQVCLI